MGYSPCGRKESDMMERLSTAAHEFAQQIGKKDSPWQEYKVLVWRLEGQKAASVFRGVGCLHWGRGGEGLSVGERRLGSGQGPEGKGLAGFTRICCDFTLIA